MTVIQASDTDAQDVAEHSAKEAKTFKPGFEPMIYPLDKPYKIGYFHEMVRVLLTEFSPENAAVNHFIPDPERVKNLVDKERHKLAKEAHDLMEQAVHQKFGLDLAESFGIAPEEKEMVGIMVSATLAVFDKRTHPEVEHRLTIPRAEQPGMMKKGAFPINRSHLLADLDDVVEKLNNPPSFRDDKGPYVEFGHTSYWVDRGPTESEIAGAKTVLNAFLKEAYHPTFRLWADGTIMPRLPIPFIEKDSDGGGPEEEASSRFFRPAVRRLLGYDFDTGLPPEDRKSGGQGR